MNKRSGTAMLRSRDVWDSEQLSRFLLQSGTPQEEVDVDIESIWSSPFPCVAMPAEVTEYQAHLTIIRGNCYIFCTTSTVQDSLNEMYDPFCRRKER